MKQASTTKFRGRRRALVAIGLTAAATILLTLLTQNALHNQSDQQFTTDSRAITQFFINDIANYNDVLYGARAFITSSSHVSQNEWDSFFEGQQAFDKNPGISSISLVQAVTPAELPAFIRDMDLSPADKQKYTVKPAGVRDQYGLARLVASPYDLTAAGGFDVFSTTDRRIVYQAAKEQNHPVASQPLTLASGKSGFFIALPVNDAAGKVTQYLVVSLRTSDFVTELYERTGSTITSRIMDTTDTAKPATLFQTDGWNNMPAELTKSDTITFGDRTWTLEYKTKRSYKTGEYIQLLPRGVIAGGLLVITLVIYTRLRDEKLHAQLISKS